MKTLCVSLGVIAILALAGCSSSRPSSLGSSQINYNNTATTTVADASASSQQLAATSSARSWLVINIASVTKSAWLGFNTDAVVGRGFRLSATSTPQFVIDLDHLYTGSIKVIGGPVSITQFKSQY